MEFMEKLKNAEFEIKNLKVEIVTQKDAVLSLKKLASEMPDAHDIVSIIVT